MYLLKDRYNCCTHHVVKFLKSLVLMTSWQPPFVIGIRLAKFSYCELTAFFFFFSFVGKISSTPIKTFNNGNINCFHLLCLPKACMWRTSYGLCPTMTELMTNTEWLKLQSDETVLYAKLRTPRPVFLTDSHLIF